MTARSRQHPCHVPSSVIPPSRCVPGFPWTQSPQISRRRKYSGVGTYPGISLISPSPSVVLLCTSSPPLLLLALVPGHGGMRGTFRRPGAFDFSLSLSVSSSFPNPSARALVGAPFPRPRRLFPLRLPSPPPGPLCIVRCSSCQVWGATLVHRTRHRQDTQLRPTRRQAHHVVLQVDCSPKSQQAPPE